MMKNTLSTLSTPGDWKIGTIAHWQNSDLHKVVSGPHLVALTFSEGDARLIAAAPELLAALQEVVNNPTRQGSYVQARAAIAKATEETP